MGKQLDKWGASHVETPPPRARHWWWWRDWCFKMGCFLRWKLLDGMNGREQSASQLGWRKGWKLVTAEWQQSKRTLLNFFRSWWLGAEGERGRKQLEERGRSGKHESGKPTCDSVGMCTESLPDRTSAKLHFSIFKLSAKTNIFYHWHWPCKAAGLLRIQARNFARPS